MSRTGSTYETFDAGAVALMRMIATPDAYTDAEATRERAFLEAFNTDKNLRVVLTNLHGMYVSPAKDDVYASLVGDIARRITFP